VLLGSNLLIVWLLWLKNFATWQGYGCSER